MFVGFMAAGKTTIGRLVADRLGWEFVDLDERIMERAGRNPGAIIRDRGEAAFRHLEAEVTRELASRRRVVLAPGGGWGADPSRAALLGPGTVRVWLRIDAAEAVRRAEREGIDRPLLGEPEGRVERAEALLRSRETSYAAAEYVVDVNSREPGAVADEIVRRLGAADAKGR